MFLIHLNGIGAEASLEVLDNNAPKKNRMGSFSDGDREKSSHFFFFFFLEELKGKIPATDPKQTLKQKKVEKKAEWETQKRKG